MTNQLKHTTRILALAAALLTALPAHAVLKDVGPADPVLVWPQWYRDLNNTALGLCKSQAVDAAIGAAYCFPIAPNPAGFAGNLGDEIFYSNLGVAVTGSNGFDLRYEAALEAAYIPGPNPTHGQEVVFSRLRFLMTIPVTGTYTVIHPYGIQVFPDVEAVGKRAVFFTIDLPPGIPGDFAGALNGNMGPFPQWADAAGNPELLIHPVSGETFLGDSATPHTFTGSPFGTNFVRVIGPPGSGIGGLDGSTNPPTPIDEIVETTGTVLGQVWTTPIATPFAVQRAVYHRTAAFNSIDVWAQSASGQTLVASGAGMATTKLAELPGLSGQYYAHIQQDATLGAPPATVTVTNFSSNPVVSSTAGLVDQVTGSASFDLGTRQLTASASSSDLSGMGFAVLGPYGAAMLPGATVNSGTFTSAAIPVDAAPPQELTIISDAGGHYVAQVSVNQTGVVNADALVANDDFPADFASAGAVVLNVAGNDTGAGAPVALAGLTVRIVSPPANGTATGSVGTGTVTYTPTPGSSGIDGFTYLLESAAGYSNVAKVEFLTTFVAPAPVAVNDAFAVRTGVAKALSVLANDTAAAGTIINLASILENSANATPTAAGTINYTAPTSTTASFTYSVANTAGTRSNNATVTVVSFGANEAITLTRADFTTSNRTWNVRGSTTWFSTALTQSKMTCWVGTATSPTASTLIGTAPIDTTGNFQLVTSVAGPIANGQRVSCQSNNSTSIGTLASRNR